MTTGMLPEGWHPDPGNHRLQRWWDGTAWTAMVRPFPRPPATGEVSVPPVQPRHRRPMSTDATRALIITAVAAVLFAVWGYTAVVDADSVPLPSATVPVPVTEGGAP